MCNLKLLIYLIFSKLFKKIFFYDEIYSLLNFKCLIQFFSVFLHLNLEVPVTRQAHNGISMQHNSLRIITNDDDMPNMTIADFRAQGLVLDEGDIRRFGKFTYFS